MLKKIFTITILFSTIAFLGSCEKCKTCDCTSVTSQTGMQDITQEFSVESCDKDEQNELEGTNTVNQGTVGFQQQITTTCTCK